MNRDSKPLLLPILGSSLLLALACVGTREARAPLDYPAARVSDHVDVYHGVSVPDPYRWLEDPDSKETRAWIEAQNELTFGRLAKVPERAAIQRRLDELWRSERYELPVKGGERYFYKYDDGQRDQAVLCVCDSLQGEPRVLLDPNTMSEDGTVSLREFKPSPDGKHLAYGLSEGGSDWRVWHVLDLASGKPTADVVRGNKFGGLEWDADSSGFFYIRYERPTDGSELHRRNAPPDIAFHRLGSQEAEDATIYPRPAAEGVFVRFDLSSDRRSMIVGRWRSSTRTNEIDLVELGEDPTSPSAPRTLVTGFDAQYYHVGDHGSTHWFRTNLDAPRGRIVAIDLNGSVERDAWKNVIPEAAEAIQNTTAVGGHLVLSYLKDATSEVRIFDTTGQLVRTLELPGLGEVGGLRGDFEEPETFYSFTSYTTPQEIHRLDVASGQTSVFKRPAPRFDAADFETRQAFYASKDGTRVPMFLTYRKGLELDGSNPVLLYGYGGFNISLIPEYKCRFMAWIEMGGVLAIANLRGGGEYGEDWHEAGTKHKKQNVFDDFIAAAEWLIDQGYTCTDKLAIAGGSNGGLLVGACVVQRPELFGAVLANVGVMDMLRFHEFTIGWAWVGDYGSSEDPDQFRTLHAYSPLHNLVPGTAYPPTLVLTADHDDRVVPAHSFKFTAAMQAAQAGPAPILIRVETQAGHSAGKPTSMRIEEEADQLAFLADVLDMTPSLP